MAQVGASSRSKGEAIKWSTAVPYYVSQQRQALTVFVQREFVEPESTGLFAHKVVSELAAQVVDGDGVFQRLHARLQTEGDLGVAHRVSVDKAAETHNDKTKQFVKENTQSGI